MTTRAKVSKTERLLNLISYMLRSATPVPFSLIAGHVVGYDDEARIDSIEKRFDRDKAELRNMGIPVEYVDGGTPETCGYIIPKDKFFLGRLELDNFDAIILALAARAGSVSFSSAIMRDAFRSAIRKLSVDLPEISDLPAEPASILQVGRGHESASENMQIVCAAVYGRRRIRFEYSGHADGSAASKRRVDPYGLGVNRGEWYLVGRCHDRDAIRMFKLGRIASNVGLMGASDAGHEFDIPEGFCVADHLAREAWQFGDAEQIQVQIEAPKALAQQLMQRSRLDCQLRSEANDRCVLEIPARMPHRMLDWLFGFGPDLKILGPEFLVAAAESRLEEIAAVYAEDPS